MDDNMKRKVSLNHYFSKKIMEMFAEGVPKDKNFLGEEKISYEEAISVLEHTISEVGKNCFILK